MAPRGIIDLDRLHANLLTSGVQKQNNALFQVIDQLINALRQVQNIATGAASSGSGSTTIIDISSSSSGMGGSDGIDGQDGFPGIPGSQGVPGISGRPGLDGVDGLDGMDAIPGPAGAPGAQGIPGITTTITVGGMDGQDGTDGIDGLPGLQGATGSSGNAGATGATGPIGIGLDGDDGLDSLIPGYPGPTGATGPQGIPGVQLITSGPPGIDGNDADEGILAVLQGFGYNFSPFQIYTNRFDITEAELEALNTTPKVLVPAPGANRIIVPLYWLPQLNITTAYTSGGIFQLQYTGLAGLNVLDPVTLTFTSSGRAIAIISNAVVTSRTWTYIGGGNDPRNKSLEVQLSANPGTPGTGVGTASFDLIYMIVSSF